MSALQTRRDIKVVLGGDTSVVDAYKVVKDSGNVKDDMFLAGVDGDREALDLVTLGGAHILSIAFASFFMEFGLGQFGAGWIEGAQLPRITVTTSPCAAT